MRLLKQRIGKTVLYKTTKIQETGKGDLYLKMEGLNPTGRMQDRLAYYLVKEARQLGHDTIIAASLGPLGESLAYVAEKYDLKCKIIMPKNSVDRKKHWFKGSNIEIIEYGRTYKDAFHKSEEFVALHDWYNANHGYYNSSIADAVYSEIAEEIAQQLGKNPDNVFCFLSNDVLIRGLHYGFRSLWRKEIIARIPKIYAASASKSNDFYKFFKQGDVDKLSYSMANKYKGITKKTIEYNIIQPLSLFAALKDSGGDIIPVSNEKIKNIILQIKKEENLLTSFRDAANIAAFIKASSSDSLKDDSTNVCILEEGKNRLNIKKLTENDFDNIEQLVFITRNYLGEYGDSKTDTKEALLAALNNGFILGAYISGKLKGIAVVARMPVKKVLPAYHLIYIGADLSSGSRGIGTKLMEEVHRKTRGNFSLHVDINNKKAIRLYQKMGLKKAYVRMLAAK